MKFSQFLENVSPIHRYPIDWDTFTGKRSSSGPEPKTAGFHKGFHTVTGATIKNFKCDRPKDIPTSLYIDDCTIESWDGIDETNITKLVIDNCKVVCEFSGLKSETLNYIELFNIKAPVKNGFIGAELPKLNEIWSTIRFKSLTQIHKAMPNVQEVNMYLGPNITNVLGTCLLSTDLFCLLDLKGNRISPVPSKGVTSVISKYVCSGKPSLLEFQAALIDAGYTEAAKL